MTTQMVDKSNFDNKQYKADLQCAYDCGFVKGAIEELEKVRTKIINKANSGQWSEPTIYGMQKAVYIIDNELSELKENNRSEQADTEFNHKAFYEYLLNVINPNEMEKYRSMFLSSGEIVN